MPTFNYVVDDEQQSTAEHQLTALQILQNAGIDPASHYLVQIEGNSNTKKSYQKNPNEEIQMHQHMKFVSISMEPTTVS